MTNEPDQMRAEFQKDRPDRVSILQNQVYLLEEDIEAFHLNLDDAGIPRKSGEETYSMWGRVCLLKAAMNTRAKQAGAGDDGLTTCNCRWKGEELVQQCTLHAAHVEAIHDWASRAKSAEKSLPPTPQPEPKALEPVAWLHTMYNEVDDSIDSRMTFEKDHGFGKKGVDFDPRFYVESEPLYTAPQPGAARLNQARVEVAEKCFKIAYSQADRIASMPPTENGDGGLWLQARYIADQIKQLSDQMRGGE